MNEQLFVHFFYLVFTTVCLVLFHSLLSPTKHSFISKALR